MKLKAVIWRPDRTNDVVVVKKKNIAGKTFRHNDVTYFVNPDRFQVTWTYGPLRMWKKYYSTFYYKQGVPHPVPVPDFQSVEEIVMDENGNPVMNGNGRPKTVQVFPKMVNVGIDGDELAQLFNPWFYRTIAPSDPTLKDQLQFYLLIGLACGVGYLLWKIHNLDVPSADEIRAIVNGAQAARSGGSVTVPSPEF